MSSVKDEPSKVPEPLTDPMELMSEASAAPEVRVVLKLSGSESRSLRASTTAEAVPLSSVSEEPSRVPVPISEAMKSISVA